jgi:hypothetical protein
MKQGRAFIESRKGQQICPRQAPLSVPGRSPSTAFAIRLKKRELPNVSFDWNGGVS